MNEWRVTAPHQRGSASEIFTTKIVSVPIFLLRTMPDDPAPHRGGPRRSPWKPDSVEARDVQAMEKLVSNVVDCAKWQTRSYSPRPWYARIERSFDRLASLDSRSNDV